MPRALVAGNGNLLATFDENITLRDFYYPHVGMEDHTTFGHLHRVGVFVDGQISWLHSDDWEHEVAYEDDTLVGHSTAIIHHQQVKIIFTDFVYTTSDILFRRLHIENLSDREREIKVFFGHDFHLYGSKALDTAIYEPKFNAVLHYRQHRYFLVNGQWENGEGIHEYCVGKSHYQGKEGTWRDAEDGKLEGNPVEQGSVDSTVGFRKNFDPYAKRILNLWLVCGKSYHDIEDGNDRVLNLTPSVIYDHTKDYWKKWVNKQDFDFSNLPESIVKLFKRSLLIIRTQIDNKGAIIAANDSDIMKFNKDTYTYMWPRDGALVAMSLSNTGYSQIVREFLEFCADLVTDEGFVFHKYNPDGSLGSSWHAKYKDNEQQLPIQEDETALLLVTMANYHQRFKETEVIQEFYNDFILRIGKFLMNFCDEKTGLPLPSYDLWEEQRGVFTYTAACTYAGLRSASELAEATGHHADAEMFFKKSQAIREAICKHLYSEQHQRFLKKVQVNNGEVFGHDPTIDASMAFIWMMGVLPPDDPRVVKTMEAIREHLWVPTDIGGISRYTGDNYQIDYDRNIHPAIPGNPWIITTLWYANWKIALAKEGKDFQEPLQILHWVTKHANSAGILPEQLHPLSGAPLSVAPLTWSHATYVDTVMKYRAKLFDIGLCEDCELPQFR